MTGPGDLTASLTFRRGAARVSLERVVLLEAIGEVGAISGAARRLGLSYKGAWDAVQALNNLFDTPLVEATPGGRAGGAARLTPRGQAVLQALKRVSGEISATLLKLESQIADDHPGDLFWSLGMKTSARNALRGTVREVQLEGVSARVVLRVADGLDIIAVVTRRSLEELQLAPDRPAIALIKAGFIRLAGVPAATPDPDAPANQFLGRIIGREDDGETCEITLEIAAGKTLVATTELENAEQERLSPGAPVRAFVEPSQVILAVE